jgi:hypothetical protein
VAPRLRPAKLADARGEPDAWEANLKAAKLEERLDALIATWGAALSRAGIVPPGDLS